MFRSVRAVPHIEIERESDRARGSLFTVNSSEHCWLQYPLWPLRTHVGNVPRSDKGRYCCKSLFALVIKNSPGCRRDFRVKMWGTSSPDDKLTGDLGNVIEITQIGGSRSDRLTTGKLSPGNFGLLQQYRPRADICSAANLQPTRSPRRRVRAASAHVVAANGSRSTHESGPTVDAEAM
jgi:hypothetical protein